MSKYDKTNEFNKENYVNVLFRINKDLLSEYTTLANDQGFKTVNAWAKSVFTDAVAKAKSNN